MEENKSLKIKKPYLIIFALALAFAIMGFIDLKVNATESYNITLERYDHEFDANGNEIKNVLGANYTIAFPDEVSLYYYTSCDIPVVSEQTAYVIAVCKQQYTTSDIQVTINGENYFVSPLIGYCKTYMGSDGGGYMEWLISGDCQKYKLNSGYDQSSFSNALKNGSVDCEQIIDYSQLQTDDNMPYPTDFSVNKIYNSTNTDKFVYDYITWTNTNKEYSIQVDIGPVVYTYENKLFGFKYGKLLAYHDSTYLLEEILEPLTHQFTFEVFDPDDYYPEKDYIPSFMAYYKEINAEYPAGTFTDYNNFNSVGYRFRYIDKSNLKAGPYVIVVPDRRNLGSYESYVLYSDGYFSSGEDSTGIYNKYENGNLDDMVADVDKEVIYKDKYETIDGDMDVTEATGWLKSVASFIKGTPDFVGSVMSFLPDPIRYGMYVCLFLGVIASGYAIVKALI